MSPVKFRAWDTRDKRMHYYSPWTMLVDGIEQDQFWAANYRRFNQDFKQMQHTGLQDKNGRDIYEGDIVRHEAHWSDSRTMSEVEWLDSAEFYPFGASDWAIQPDNVEVIGNIYENPELTQ